MMGDSSAVGATGQPGHGAPATGPSAMSMNRMTPSAALVVPSNASLRVLATAWPDASSAASASASSPYDAPGAAGGPDLFITIEQFHEAFCADLSDDVAGPMAVSQRPLAAAAFTEPASAVGWRDLPSWYLVSEHDNAIPPDRERFMAKRMNAITESVDGSHVAFIARPEVASGLVLKALASV